MLLDIIGACSRSSEEHTLLSRWLLYFGCNPNADQSIVGFELLQRLWRIIDESETGCLSTTKFSAQTEDVDLFLVCLVHLSEFATEFFFGDVGSAGVEDVTVKMSDRPLP